MKLNKIGIILISILTVFAFTSCDDEDEWIRARLDRSTYPNNPYTNNGYLDVTFDFYDTDIRGYNPGRDRVHNINIAATSLSFYSNNFYYNDRLEVTLETDAGALLRNLRLYVDRDGYAYIDGQNQAYLNFMYDFVNQIITRGDVELYVYVDTGVSQRIPIEIEFLNDLDLYID